MVLKKEKVNAAVHKANPRSLQQNLILMQSLLKTLPLLLMMLWRNVFEFSMRSQTVKLVRERMLSRLVKFFFNHFSKSKGVSLKYIVSIYLNSIEYI